MPLRNSMKVPLCTGVSTACPATNILRGGVPLDGNVEISDIMQDEAAELLVLLLAEPFNEAVAGEVLSQTNSRKAVLSEAVVEQIQHCSLR